MKRKEKRGSENLRLVSKAYDEAGDRQRRLVHKCVVDAFVAKVAGKNTTIGCETRDGNADVIVNLEYLFLIGGEVGGGLVDGG